MEQKLINQFADDLECLKQEKSHLVRFQESLEEYDLPSDIEREINLKVSNQIDWYDQEIEQLTIDLDFSEEGEAMADLECKYQETIKVED